LSAFQSLALALLVHTDDQCVLRWAQVQTHNVAQLLDEERVIRQLEALAAVRLQTKKLKVALYAGLGDTGLGSDAAHAPVRRAIGRLGMQRRLDEFGHTFVVNGAWLAWAHIVIQTCDTPFDEARAPLAYCRFAELHALGDRVVRLTISAAQNNASPGAQRRWQRTAPRKGLKLRTLLLRQQQMTFWSSCSHRGISVPKIPQTYKINASY